MPHASSQLDAFRSFALDAVREAGRIQLAHLDRHVHVMAKGDTDIVTDADLEVERMFRARVAERFPGHRVLGEELANEAEAGQRETWLFDPVDGTANFANGLPFFCASLALEIDGVTEVAAVYEPVRQELFAATRAGGATLNGRPLRVSRAAELRRAVVGCGFPHGATARNRAMEDVVGEAAVRARGFRRLGSAALDLSYVGAGRLDAFWDRGLQAWDTAAGALIVAEAGGTVTDLDGSPFACRRGSILASNGPLHSTMLDLLRGRP